MQRLLSRVVFAVLACLVLATPGRAGLVTWSYSITPDTPSVKADGTSSIGVVQLSSDPLVQAAGSTGVVLANLTAVSTVNPQTPETFTSAGWKVTMTIFDPASGTSGALSFTGAFTGTLSSGGSLIHNVFTGLASQSITLGNDTYTVTPDSYLGPSVPNATGSGGIGATVVVTSVGTAGAPSPEPSSLVLGGVGAAGCFLVRRRKRARLAAC